MALRDPMSDAQTWYIHTPTLVTCRSQENEGLVATVLTGLGLDPSVAKLAAGGSEPAAEVDMRCPQHPGHVDEDEDDDDFWPPTRLANARAVNVLSTPASEGRESMAQQSASGGDTGLTGFAARFARMNVHARCEHQGASALRL